MFLSRFDELKPTGEWTSAWLGHDWWHKYVNPTSSIAETEADIRAVAEVFTPKWLREELARTDDRHPVVPILALQNPLYIEDLNMLGGNIRRFKAAKRFPTVANGLRSRQDFPHARCCLEVAALMTGQELPDVEFERPRGGDPDHGECDVFLAGGAAPAGLWIEVKVPRQSAFEEVFFELSHRLTFPMPPPELRGCSEVQFLQEGISARLKKQVEERVTIETLLGEVLRLAKETPVGETRRTSWIQITRKGSEGAPSIGGPSYDANAIVQRLVQKGGAIYEAFEQIPKKSASLIVMEPWRSVFSAEASALLQAEIDRRAKEAPDDLRLFFGVLLLLDDTNNLSRFSRPRRGTRMLHNPLIERGSVRGAEGEITAELSRAFARYARPT